MIPKESESATGNAAEYAPAQSSAPDCQRSSSRRRVADLLVAMDRPEGISERAWQECRENARKVLLQNLEVQQGQHALFITDETRATDQRFITVLQQALQEMGVCVAEVVLREDTDRQTMLKQIRKADIIWSATNFDLEPAAADL